MPLSRYRIALPQMLPCQRFLAETRLAELAKDRTDTSESPPADAEVDASEDGVVTALVAPSFVETLRRLLLQLAALTAEPPSSSAPASGDSTGEEAACCCGCCCCCVQLRRGRRAASVSPAWRPSVQLCNAAVSLHVLQLHAIVETSAAGRRLGAGSVIGSELSANQTDFCHSACSRAASSTARRMRDQPAQS